MFEYSIKFEYVKYLKECCIVMVENKKELAEFLKKQLSHYNISDGFIYECLELFEIKIKCECLNESYISSDKECLYLEKKNRNEPRT